MLKFLPSDQNIVGEVIEPNVAVKGFASTSGPFFIPVRAVVWGVKRNARANNSLWLNAEADQKKPTTRRNLLGVSRTPTVVCMAGETDLLNLSVKIVPRPSFWVPREEVGRHGCSRNGS